jgi:hypothetical protein
MPTPFHAAGPLLATVQLVLAVAQLHQYWGAVVHQVEGSQTSGPAAKLCRGGQVGLRGEVVAAM